VSARARMHAPLVWSQMSRQIFMSAVRPIMLTRILRARSTSQYEGEEENGWRFSRRTHRSFSVSTMV